MKNEIGKTFGRLTVISRAPTPDKRRTEAWWKCICICGKEKDISGQRLRQGTSRSCGCLRSDSAKKRVGRRHTLWNGGRQKLASGYVVISDKGRKISEHRLVMEKMIGRVLLSTETVHHKNGIRDDNRPENLELWSNTHSAGQRVEDLITWAKEILRRYEKESHETTVSFTVLGGGPISRNGTCTLNSGPPAGTLRAGGLSF